VSRPCHHRQSPGAATAVRAAVLAVASAGIAWAPPAARGQTVTLSGSAVGSTPSVLGYNSGHFLPGSNTASWWKHAGVNGSRIFSSPSYLTPGTSTYFRSQSTLSLSATTQAQFVTQRDALRASGTATTFVRWDRIVPLYATGTTDGNNSIQLKTAEDSMKALGIKPLIVMTRSPASYTWPASPAANSAADWQDRWLAWQQWYAQAFVHAQYNDVENFQFFNEPDLYASSNGTLTQDQWLEMVRFGANAVESAIADVNRLSGKSLTPHVYGPVTTGPETAAGGWGDLLLRNRSNQLITGSSSSYRLFDHYDYHNYGSSPTTFGTRVADTIAAINATTGGQAAQFPIVLSEFNTRTSSNYDPTDTVNNPNGFTPDSLDMSSRLGQILVNLAPPAGVAAAQAAAAHASVAATIHRPPGTALTIWCLPIRLLPGTPARRSPLRGLGTGASGGRGGRRLHVADRRHEVAIPLALHDHVLAKQPGRLIAIPSHDRIDDRLVLGERRPHAVADAELKAAKRPQAPLQLDRLFSEEGVVRGPVDRLVEGLVLDEVVVGRALVAGPLAGFVGRHERGLLVVRDPSRGQPGTHRLQFRHHLEHLADPVRAGIGHHRPPPRAESHHARGTQLDQRLADRRPGNAKLTGQGHLVEPHARRVTAVRDPLLDHLPNGERPLGGRGGSAHGVCPAMVRRGSAERDHAMPPEPHKVYTRRFSAYTRFHDPARKRRDDARFRQAAGVSRHDYQRSHVIHTC
jgi:hypothetical protein